MQRAGYAKTHNFIDLFYNSTTFIPFIKEQCDVPSENKLPPQMSITPYFY